MSKWLNDLEQGNKGERVIAEYITNKKPTYEVVEFRNDKLYDFKIREVNNNSELTFEVKTDRYEFIKGYMTYNIFIETSCSGKDSGIMSSQADYFVYYFPDFEEAYFIQSDKLRDFVKTHMIDGDGIEWKSQSGDGGRVEGVCIHRKYWRKIFNVVTIKKDKSIWK
jgi:hypothetical protein